ncbi:unnamed protein product [Didymodactylos carnosus]|uniref:Uncharacterized protein n=1 Tax=Didymodactylos carnosus TaxID=1234261 RepID=A0A814U1A5_9BILA|nr:unnamed protein product [Didymodactylos carnosus]CAF3932160.1 unnamed protein product [Didymodactylos carnosus]
MHHPVVTIIITQHLKIFPMIFYIKYLIISTSMEYLIYFIISLYINQVINKYHLPLHVRLMNEEDEKYFYKYIQQYTYLANARSIELVCSLKLLNFNLFIN